MERFGVKRDSYVLIAPGGGTAHPGAEDAPQIVADAAARIASHGCTTLLLGVQSRDASGWLQHVPRVPMAQLAELVRGAKLVVSNGGDTLLQVIACRRPCVAVPIAGDQAHRIRECVRMGLALEARLDADDIERVVMKLLDDESARMALTASAARGAVTNGIDIAVSAIVRLAAAREPTH
jgi:UDP:flavonoid glycosyltransferase YjiC (YdhE family)